MGTMLLSPAGVVYTLILLVQMLLHVQLMHKEKKTLVGIIKFVGVGGGRKEKLCVLSFRKIYQMNCSIYQQALTSTSYDRSFTKSVGCGQGLALSTTGHCCN